MTQVPCQYFWVTNWIKKTKSPLRQLSLLCIETEWSCSIISDTHTPDLWHLPISMVQILLPCPILRYQGVAHWSWCQKMVHKTYFHEPVQASSILPLWSLQNKQPCIVTGTRNRSCLHHYAQWNLMCALRGRRNAQQRQRNKLLYLLCPSTYMLRATISTAPKKFLPWSVENKWRWPSWGWRK